MVALEFFPTNASGAEIVQGPNLTWLVEMVTLKAILFDRSAANQAKWSNRKSVRGWVVIRNYLGIPGTDFDERPPKHVSICDGSNGPSEKSWKIPSEKIWRDQGRVSWSDSWSDFSIFRISRVWVRISAFRLG